MTTLLAGRSREARHLNQYWNAVSDRTPRGDRERPAGAIEPRLVSMIYTLHQTERREHLAPAAADRLERDLRQFFASAHPAGTATTAGATRPRSMRATAPSPWLGNVLARPVPRFTSVVMLLLLFTAASVAVWGRGGGSRNAIESGTLTAPDPGSLVRITLPGWTALVGVDTYEPDVVLSSRIDLVRIAIPPGSSYFGLTALTVGYDIEPGTIVTEVESGVVVVMVDGPASLFRRGETGESPFTIGEETVLQTGDVLLTGAGTHRTIRAIENAASLLELGDQTDFKWLFDSATGPNQTGDAPADLKQNNPGMLMYRTIAEGIDPHDLPSGPLVVSIRRVSLPAGFGLPISNRDAVVFLGVESGQIAVMPDAQADGSAGGRTFTYRRGASVLVNDGHGVTKTVAASGEGTADLLVVSISPA